MNSVQNEGGMFWEVVKTDQYWMKPGMIFQQIGVFSDVGILGDCSMNLFGGGVRPRSECAVYKPEAKRIPDLEL